jgi:CheY-like chemotaxis protein
VIETKPFGEVTLNLTLRQSSHSCVLVIDDNAGLIELLQRYLTGEPYEVMGASDGREGLFLASERRPDVIVLDIMMPQQDGWEVLQRLKTQEKTRDIPVIVCSVLNDPELAFSLGACEFLAKPVTRDRLLTALKRCQ